ncbi:MAG: hypothetical protein RLZZ579_578 [Actinomycetota bacterium]|jgi:hypothetical protein
MTVNMPAKHASWLHSHLHPSIQDSEPSRVAIMAARFLFQGGSIRILTSRVSYFDRSSKCEPSF